MIELQGNVEIQRPVEVVFTFLSDLGNAPKWQRGVIESKRVTEGPLQLGTQFHETVRMMGMSFEAVCKVIAFEPPRKFGMTADGKLVHYEGEFTFEPISGDKGTRLNVSGWMKMKGVWRILEWLAAGEIRNESLAELNDIKRAVEAQP
jgi:uncharacterized membrane protein